MKLRLLFALGIVLVGALAANATTITTTVPVYADDMTVLLDLKCVETPGTTANKYVFSINDFQDGVTQMSGINGTWAAPGGNLFVATAAYQADSNSDPVLMPNADYLDTWISTTTKAHPAPNQRVADVLHGR